MPCLQWGLASLTYFSSKAAHELRIFAYSVLHMLERLVACLRQHSEEVAVGYEPTLV